MDYFGFAGKVLKIDLTTGEIKKEPLDIELCRRFLGGAGAGWRMLFDYLRPETDPFSPDNPIIISSGALVATGAYGMVKIAATTKFPIVATRDHRYYVGSSIGGAEFGTMLKRAGYDHLIITGKSEKPVYIRILDDKVEICDASLYWKKMDIFDTTDALKEKYGKNTSVIAIGLAGENLVRYAIAYIDKKDSLGKSGFGAVMGSKNLKAIAVGGTGKIKIADKERFEKAVEYEKKIFLSWGGREQWLKMGMAAGWDTFKFTQYPGKRWTREEWSRYYGNEKRRESIDKILACPYCLLDCRIRWKIPSGEFAGEVGYGSPYSKGATSGLLLGISDINKMLHWVTLANRAGICFYTSTRLIDFVTQLYVEGRLTRKDTDGFELRRDYEFYLELFDKIIKKQGLGEILAEGWIITGEKLGIKPEEYWYCGISKGTDIIYEARTAKLHPLIFGYVTNPRPHHGGLHTLTVLVNQPIEAIRKQIEGWGLSKETVERIFTPAEYTGKFNIGRYARYMEDAMAVKNSTGLCAIYTVFGPLLGKDLAEIYSAATGIEYSAEEMIKAGERAFNVKKLLNVREGFTRKDDKFPDIWTQPLNTPEGKEELTDYYKIHPITREDLNRLLDDYYDERGWNKEKGIPSKEKLEDLELSECSDALNFVK